MSQNKLLGDQIRKTKRDIKTRYLAGESVPSIARDCGVSDRNIYYHLGVITPDEKALHVKNAALRRMAEKKSIRKEEQQHGTEESPSAESTEQTTGSSLSDFVE